MEAIAVVLFLGIYGGILFLTLGGYWKTFSKAGQPGWACLIPIYNVLVMADVAKVSRNYIWKALGVAFVGNIFYAYTVLSSINSTSLNGGLLGAGILAAFAGSILALYFMFPVYKGIALNFGQGVGFAWGLMLLNIVFFAILGFGNYQYQADFKMRGDDILDVDL